ncbi:MULTISPECIES: AbrB/MazE/SpoVT family DNA-binding domain-containing protein [Bacillus]|uniref:Transition state regulatory protein AbrB n=1 Tax=Bacillus cereus TaxID=1396 RepID=A0A162PAH4_BACCE|nr:MULTISPECIES: AbrB/MazE/SpoVT family DNA-binding domain-containing protein [Bacillus]KZD70037.1 transition state regulatory protein AbrB [Bacillus cereus]MCU5248723.1 AbrB/MazE/SpoVT family DNA-binding domain-containing protein [Bacillus pacificus]MDA1532125.1 AbrB/MazE/SpoVT family DNA-binding domain-containing protein [Bacillus cereus group sp. TH260-2LC]MDX9640252.1 AbrB/MazE/SpoVT family DNA-binding domain-containing protein [Bacillus sp. PBL-C9]HDR6771355.1 AbrB/MazE/SpoVT family DNA-b
MKATGITRKVDELGRIVIPKELRKTLNIDTKDPIEIFTEEDSIILRKYESNMTCMITGEVSNKNISLFNGKIVVSPEGAELLIKELHEIIVPTK